LPHGPRKRTARGRKNRRRERSHDLGSCNSREWRLCEKIDLGWLDFETVAYTRENPSIDWIHLRFKHYLNRFTFNRTFNTPCNICRSWRSGRWRRAISSPGFVAIERHDATPKALILHVDWVLRSLARRFDKIRSYEDQDAERGRACLHFALPELIPESWHMFMPVPDGSYSRFAEQIFQAVSDL
jgi:hypothetical protein